MEISPKDSAEVIGYTVSLASREELVEALNQEKTLDVISRHWANADMMGKIITKLSIEYYPGDDWEASASCSGLPSDLLVTAKAPRRNGKETPVRRKLELAEQICGGCNVQEHCTERLRANRKELFGVWGGHHYRDLSL